MYLRIGTPYTGTPRGFRITPANATTDTVVTIPNSAISVILWFERPGSGKNAVPEMVGGKLVCANSATKITNFTEGFAEQPPEAMVWPLRMRTRQAPSHLHLAVLNTGDVICGTWLYA